MPSYSVVPSLTCKALSKVGPLQWTHDEAALPAEAKAFLEHRQAGSQTQGSTVDAAGSQQQVRVKHLSLDFGLLI